MITQRFNPTDKWSPFHFNYEFMGFIEMLSELSSLLSENLLNGSNMIEIGSYMGESTKLFGCTKLFNKIYSIDPHTGQEKFNEIANITWGEVIKEYQLNTKLFNNIEHIKDFSYNVVDKFEDNSIDFIYVDGAHDYESVKRDLKLYLPKLKNGGIIGGHDYNPKHWPDVCKAVTEVVGNPYKVFRDTSWIYVKKNLI